MTANVGFGLLNETFLPFKGALNVFRRPFISVFTARLAFHSFSIFDLFKSINYLSLS